MRYVLLSFSVLLGTLLSCSKDDNDPSAIHTVVNAVSTGTWKITYFFDTDQDETSHYAGYHFTFGSGNGGTDLLTFERN